MACLLKNEPTSSRSLFNLKGFALKVKRNQVLKARSRIFPRGEKAGDPKPSELAITRVNLAEMREEARTREPCNTLG